MPKQIIIKSYATISALGHNKTDILNNYKSLKSFISNKTFNNKIYPVGIIPEESEKQIKKLIASNPKLKKLDRTAILALFTAQNAIEEIISEKEKLNIGVSIGSSRGATSTFENIFSEYLNNRNAILPIITSPVTTLGNISSTVAAHLNISGPFISHSSTCSTGLQSLANAIAWLKAEMADIFIAGASEAPLTPFTLAQVEALGIYSNIQNTPYPCQPLSIETQNTFVLGEGAASFVLQNINLSQNKSTNFLAKIESIGYAYEKPPSLTGISINESPLIKSMSMAIEKANNKKPIDLIILHAPGTLQGDKSELNAIKTVFGNNIPMLFSNKWITGHTYATSGLLNLELAILCINNNFLPSFPYKTIIETKIRTKKINRILINATGFGGNAISLIVSK
jgi:3-oxoacyl-(acyl-carrier-protein) synthase